MKTKMILSGLLISGIALAISQTTHAEDAQGLKKAGSANVELTSGTTVITPPAIEPYPPTGPMLPVGELGITSATDLYFDSIELTDKTATRDALYIKADGTPISNVVPTGGTLATVPTDGSAFVPGYSVTDRRGTGAGWNLTLTLGEFKQQNVATGAPARTLAGATLAFPEVTPITSSGATGSGAPTTFAKTFNAGGSASVLMNAKADQGLGIWEARYNSRALELSDGTKAVEKPIVLSVPSNNYVGQYKADLTWNLSDTPATNPAG